MKIVVYSADWCSDCIRSKRLLKREGAAFAEIDTEEVSGAEAEMKALNGGDKRIPTILIESEHGRDILIEPEDPDLLAALKRHRATAVG